MNPESRNKITALTLKLVLITWLGGILHLCCVGCTEVVDLYDYIFIIMIWTVFIIPIKSIYVVKILRWIVDIKIKVRTMRIYIPTKEVKIFVRQEVRRQRFTTTGSKRCYRRQKQSSLILNGSALPSSAVTMWVFSIICIRTECCDPILGFHSFFPLGRAEVGEL